MYFRDMAELDVLRPEQEFETTRKIEEPRSTCGGRSWLSRRACRADKARRRRVNWAWPISKPVVAKGSQVSRQLMVFNTLSGTAVDVTWEMYQDSATSAMSG
jgi:hypothetical protein